MHTQPSAALGFPDVPKLELDDLIDQLVERAQDVKRSQGRLRALLRAIETVSGDLAIDAVLRNVVAAACELAGARYGALGVLAFDGSLEQFVHVGMDEDTVAAIGHLPEGHGLLGALTRHPLPIRLQHMAADERSSGTPDQHPAMDSFLGVPVRVAGEVFGNLYLTDSSSGRFSAEDEELVGALALAAGAALSNARLLEESRLQQRWLAASVEISTQLMAPAGEDPLRTIARRASEIADADLVTVGLLTADRRELVIEVASGLGSEELLGSRFAVAGTFVDRVIEDRSALLLPTGDGDEGAAHVLSAIEIGPLIALPLEGAQGVRGVLVLVRSRGKRPFSGADLTMAASFASHADVALELADARSTEQRLVLSEDRDRIARDLHDHVIQELFAIGLSLQATATRVGPDVDLAARLTQRVIDIDRTIRHIRTSIFELRGPLGDSDAGTRRLVLDIAAELAAPLGFSPRVTFAGLVETMPADMVGDVTACVREVLTNVAKHARATRVDLELTITAVDLTVLVRDDGSGYEHDGRLSGLANLRTRAELRGGTFEIFAGPTKGTTVIWKVPLP